jgi:beta-lactamase regulating signal transducer with metallopeptidase domain
MNTPAVTALAWTLVHFIWQGAVVALLAGFAISAFRIARPATRYAVWCGALGAMALLPVITFAVLRGATLVVAASSAAVVATPAPVAVAASVSASPRPADPAWIAWLVGLWLSGVVILGARSTIGWALAQRLKTRLAAPAGVSLQRVAASLRTRLGIRRGVAILTTAAAEVPATLGWLKPVVLLPVSALTALTPEQIEMLIAHELAHVRRHDYLVNLAQTAVETVLFYHPAVWWVSGRVRAEREHCCDDLAVAACGNVPGYVRALARLEELAGARPALVVAADGGSLGDRIQRLLRREHRVRQAPPVWLGALLPAAAVLAAVLSTTPPQAAVTIATTFSAKVTGFLGGLTDAGYTNLSVDQIIALKEHGVDPDYIKAMLGAGLGTPGVEQMIRLREHGVDPAFVASIVTSGLVDDLDVGSVVRLRENGVDGEDMGRVRALGFGPFSAGDVIRLRQHGVESATFEALKEAGLVSAGVDGAVQFRENDVTVERVRGMKRQGFDHLSLEQIVKLRRAGII